MGVKGLETFLKENRSISRTINLDQISAKGRERIPIIVDAWGLIYRLYQSSLPWTGGGEYLAFYRLVKRLLAAWKGVGLDPLFVFDGAAPPEKHETIISRLNDNITSTQLFYATSTPSRSSPSFSRSSANSLLPPFCSHVFVQAIHDVGAKSHFVAIGEADGVCAVLAERLGGYLMGQDSDFVILMGEGGRSKGYVPFDMMSWYPGPEEDEPEPSDRNEPDEDFTTVSNPKQQRRIRESSLLPPPELRNPTLNLVIYPPSALRTRLRIPSNVLPLFASLCGTDYTPPQASFHFFEPTLKLVQRIEKVARVLREQLYSPSAPKARTAGDHAADLVSRVIKKLLVRPFQTESEGRVLVDAIVDATLQYTLPTMSRCCDYHPFCGTLNIESGCQSESVSGVSRGVREFAAANTRGEFRGSRHGYLYPDMVHLNQVLEDPSRASIKLQGLAGVRKVAWEIMDEVLGLRFVPPELEDDVERLDVTMESEDQVDAKDAKADEVDSKDARSEITLVEEEDQASLANSPAELVTDITLSSTTDPTPAETQSRTPQPLRIVTEFVRSSNRIIAHQVHLHPSPNPTSTSDTPRSLQPLSERLSTYLSTLSSNTPLILALPLALQPIIAIIRFCILDTSPKDAWRAAEVTSLLEACLGTYFAWRREGGGDCPSKKETNIEYPLLTNRNAQLAAHLQAVMTDSHVLAEALLLSNSSSDSESKEEEHEEMTHLRTYMFYSGSTIHRFLQKTKPEGWKWSQGNQETHESCLAALVDGIEDRIVGWNLETPIFSIPATEMETAPTKGREDADEESELNGRKRKDGDPPFPSRVEGGKTRPSKKKNGKNKGKGAKGPSQGQGGQGRFDLLNGLTE